MFDDIVKIIFCNGTFDILHPGHVRLLNFAKSQGAYLIVAIDSDRRVKELKGPTRPINSQDVRTEMLMALKSVDEVVVFDTKEQLEDIVKHSKIYAIVKGSDHKNDYIEGSQYVEKVIWFDRIDEYSSTKTIQSITGR